MSGEKIDVLFHKYNTDEPNITVSLGKEETVESAKSKIAQELKLNPNLIYFIVRGQIMKNKTKFSQLQTTPDVVFEVYERANYKVSSVQNKKTDKKADPNMLAGLSALKVPSEPPEIGLHQTPATPFLLSQFSSFLNDTEFDDL
ncbi:hypothetical protein GPJ56_005276 [Histomonas meleagridis]|uniref:uncharacterized protein n=1 Tax=Histomonas meleagridis TaxID=135588 RepID=UPI00355A72B7|nr:hypothetical protein GPJ56_005276 [Histomonas meleagridis]KAH0802125.1 hypothetical protein GO595_005206 [Histomonas meleagridis]